MLSSASASRNNSSKGKQALYNCSWCAKPFKYPSQLKEHIRVHTREKPYPCSYCTKAFSHSSALTQHERIHTGEKPFHCSWCDKSFSQSSNLKRHERVHTSSGQNPEAARRQQQAQQQAQQRASSNIKRGISESNGQNDGTRAMKKLRTQVPQQPQQQQVQQQPPTINKQDNSYTVKTEDRLYHSPYSNSYRELYPRSDIKGSPRNAILNTPRSVVIGIENIEPTPEIGGTFQEKMRQAALNKSIESYLDCPQSMSPLIQDDVNNFLMTRLAWSPSVLLSPRSPLRGLKSPIDAATALKLESELPSSSLSRATMGIVESPSKIFMRSNLGEKTDRVSQFRF